MEQKDFSRSAIEASLAKMGDYVKIDFLTRCLKRGIDIDTKKFVMLKLALIYDERRMPLEGAKLMRNVAELEATDGSRINAFIKSAEMYVKANAFEEADISFSKAAINTNESQKAQMKARRRELYLAQAKLLIQKERRAQAIKVYEKLVVMDFAPQEKKEIQQQLLSLYEKLGKMNDYFALKKGM